MKKTFAAVAAVAALMSTVAPVQARDNKLTFPIAGAMSENEAKGRLGDDVQFFFGDQKPAGKVQETLGSDKTSQKTNSVGKSPQTACNWAFLSAMLQLKKRANALGADAIVNIQSNYNNQPLSSATDYECHDGAIMTGVALKADFVRLQKKK
ncbi:excinuclease ATPase subunit [Pseudoduganella violaceinigra]|uniref:excinuclease ATPase subunit n=1 Tax=Pseudoduganella violaceinigra TaxID=246602 RepID=UPI00040428EA|nr:excinuclease ATPase subunit [Pseudoduganella violaceinigra]